MRRRLCVRRAGACHQSRMSEVDIDVQARTKIDPTIMSEIAEMSCCRFVITPDLSPACACTAPRGESRAACEGRDEERTCACRVTSVWGGANLPVEAPNGSCGGADRGECARTCEEAEAEEEPGEEAAQVHPVVDVRREAEADVEDRLELRRVRHHSNSEE